MASRRTSDRTRDLSNVTGIPTARGGRSRKLHSTPNFVQQELANPGPWVGMASSRLTQARYDYGLRAIFIQFRNGSYYIYESVPLAVWWRFRRAASKGKFVSRVLNSFPYRPATDEEALRPTTHIETPGA